MSIGPSGIGGVGAFGALVAGPGAVPNEQWPDADAPINDSNVENNSTPPQIVAGAPFIQPNSGNPADSAEVDASSSVAKPGPNVIAADAVFVQPDSGNPEDNPAVGVSTARAGALAANPLGIGPGWQGNYQQPT